MAAARAAGARRAPQVPIAAATTATTAPAVITPSLVAPSLTAALTALTALDVLQLRWVGVFKPILHHWI